MIIYKDLLHYYYKFKSYLNNAGLYFISSLFVSVVGLCFNPILASNLSPNDYAILGYYSSFNLLLIPLSHFCLMTYYSREYYFTPEDKREDLTNTLLLSINIIGFFSVLFFSVLMYCYVVKAGVNFPFYPYALLTFIQLFVSNNVTFYLTKLRITRQAKKYALFSISQCLIGYCFIILFVVVIKGGALGKLWSTLLSTFLFGIIGFRCSISSFRINKSVLKSALKFCLPLTISSIFWFFLTGVDRLFLERLDDQNSLGIYQVGLSIAAYAQIFYTTLSSTFDPDIYQAIANNDTKKTFIIIAIIISVVTIMNVLFLILSPILIDLLTAGRYVESTVYARIFSIGNIMMAIYYMIVKLIVGYGYSRGELLVRITGAIISIGVYYYLIRDYTFKGAAWGQVISFTIISLIGIVYLLIKKKKR